MIAARVNGEPVELDDGTDLRALVLARVERINGLAVAINEAVVPRSQWDHTTISDGDRVEILTAAQGG